jgi:hypothetical protein
MPSPHRVRRCAAFVVTSAWLLLAAASASAHPPDAAFDYTPTNPAPGEEVTFRSTSTGPPEHTQFLAHEWDLDGDGQFDDGNETVARHAYPEGVHVVRLRVRYLSADGSHVDVAERSITVGEPGAEPTPTPTPESTPVPDSNEPPVAALDKRCSMKGGFLFCAGLLAREQKPHTIDASPSHDPDGTIVRYEWDLDGTGGFERDTGASPTVTHTFEAYKGLVDPRKRPVRVRVTDDEGATAEAAMTLSLLEPSCESLVKKGRLSASGTCLRPRKIEVDGKNVVRWYSEHPVTINGIRIAPAAQRTVTIDLPAEPGAPAPRIAGKGAVSVQAQGMTVNLYNGAFSWGMSDGVHLSGFQLGAAAKLNGLKITGLAGAPELSSDKISSRLALRVALPAQFGGATSDDPIVLSPGKTVASASSPLSFEVANAAIGPIGLESLKVTFDGEDLWEISTRVKLPPPIPYTVGGDAGIRDGEFEHAGAEVNFGTPGIGPLGPVFLQRIAFRIEIAPKKSKCVPKVGIEVFDQQQFMKDTFGWTFDPPLPKIEIDHGVPTFALCGEVGLTGGPTVLGAAAIRLDAGLGLATYADRPAVFRAFGKLYLVEIPIAKAALELHTNGYTRARADFHWGIDGLASLQGYLLFEMLMPKFNAIAYVDACLDFVDWCAGGRAIVSSKGVAVCLKIDVLVDDWEPGFGYRWGDTLPDLYFAGCDIGEYREHIDSGIDQHIRTVKAVASAKTAGHQEEIELPAGLPGATIVARGEGAPPKIGLIGPKGERISSPDDMRPVQQAPFFVMKDPRANLTQFAISKPSAGRWRVVVEEGSAPVVSIASANGLEKPVIKGTVSGRGARRTLSYRVKPVDGQKVTFIERGPSAGRRIGAASGRSGRIAFRPAPGRAERRRIVALVTQHGRSRGEYEVTRYEAPGAQRPGRARALRVTRRGSKLRIAWRAARPADEQEVRVRLSDGRRLLFRTRRNTLAVPRVKRGVGARVSVRGVLHNGTVGRPTAARAA